MGLAQTNDPRWYAIVRCENSQGLAAAKVSQLIVDTYIDPFDALANGFVAHPLWLGTGTDSWVEVGYDKEPSFKGSSTYFYWATVTPSGFVYYDENDATLNTYKEFKIIWNKVTNKWDVYVGSQKIGQVANVGGPNNNLRSADAGLETTSDKNSSPKAPVYGLQYATLSNYTWRDCSNAGLLSNSPARIYWVNPPYSAETVMP